MKRLMRCTSQVTFIKPHSGKMMGFDVSQVLLSVLKPTLCSVTFALMIRVPRGRSTFSCALTLLDSGFAKGSQYFHFAGAQNPIERAGGGQGSMS